MTLSTDVPAVRNAIAAIETDCQRLSKIGSDRATIEWAQTSLSRILGAIDILCVLIGRDHPELERVSALAAIAYIDAADRIEKRDAAAQTQNA